MTGSIAPNRPGHHGTVVARTVGTVAISCNVPTPELLSKIIKQFQTNVTCWHGTKSTNLSNMCIIE